MSMEWEQSFPNSVIFFQVTGLLTVEFLFKDSPLSFSPQTKPTGGNDHCVQPGNSVSLQLLQSAVNDGNTEI